MLEESQHLLLGRRSRIEIIEPFRRRRIARLEPLIADQQHRLGEVQRGKGRVHRHHQRRIRQHHIVIRQPRPLRPEEHACLAAAADHLAQLLCRRLRRQDRLHHVAVARRRRNDIIEIGHCLLAAGMHHHIVDHRVGARRDGARPLVRPAIARIDQAHLGKPEIEHGAGSRAYIFTHLRLDQNHRWPRLNRCKLRFCLIRSGHGLNFRYDNLG